MEISTSKWRRLQLLVGVFISIRLCFCLMNVASCDSRINQISHFIGKCEVSREFDSNFYLLLTYAVKIHTVYLHLKATNKMKSKGKIILTTFLSEPIDL